MYSHDKIKFQREKVFTMLGPDFILVDKIGGFGKLQDTGLLLHCPHLAVVFQK